MLGLVGRVPTAGIRVPGCDAWLSARLQLPVDADSGDARVCLVCLGSCYPLGRSGSSSWLQGWQPWLLWPLGKIKQADRSALSSSHSLSSSQIYKCTFLSIWSQIYPLVSKKMVEDMRQKYVRSIVFLINSGNV